MSEKENNSLYWRSLDDLADTPEFRTFVENEFPGLAEHMRTPVGRRHFLKVMGAAAAMAGLAGCRWPVEKIVPYAHRPEGRDPGNPVQYATCLHRGGAARGLLATSVDGRPIKLDGNPLHPASLGGSSALDQAAILDLYDPDRSKNPVLFSNRGEIAKTWDDVEAFFTKHFGALRAARGQGLYVLSQATASPSVARMFPNFQMMFPRFKWYEYEPLCNDNERQGALWAFGLPLRTHYSLDLAKVVVCLDADLLGAHPQSVCLARSYARGRTADHGDMSRVYSVESSYTLTGAAADRRLALPSANIKAFTLALAAELFVKRRLPLPPGLDSLLTYIETHTKHAFDPEFIKSMADDLAANRTHGLVAAGAGQPPEVHTLCHIMNAALGNVLKTVTYTEEPFKNVESHTIGLKELTDAMLDGKVQTLLVLGANPVYNAPADVPFSAALKKVKTSIHLGLYKDETARACTWHLPQAHFLESWGDALAYDGTLTLQQPLIQPLYDGRTAPEILALAMGVRPFEGFDIVKKTINIHYFRVPGKVTKEHAARFEEFWRKALHDGLIPGTKLPERKSPFVPPGYLDRLDAGDSSLAKNEYEIVFREDYKTYDGRYANNAWLQELPDPITKIAWDNAAVMSPATAGKIGAAKNDVVRLTFQGRSMELPVYILPGHADNSVTVALGYGRTHAGRVGNKAGASAYAIRTQDATGFGRGLTIKKTGEKHTLAMTQDHHAIGAVGEKEKKKRVPRLIREATLAHYKEHPEFAKHAVHHPPLKALWKELEFEGRKWAMSIDLSKCTGCSACVIACQAENNIPVVGREQVIHGREMHWIRIDRYFRGAPGAPQVAFQPLPCQQCFNAPCEQVCPVAATMHTKEGLNDMVYNRCIGMRFCSQNCPYKVRRFNYFWFHPGLDDVSKMKFNPEVTVRSRGVMEKCTYCVQRIQRARIQAKNERRPIADGEIAPACAQACPAGAIVFGDLSDPDSAVRKLHEHNRSYAILEDYNTQPRTRYLARLRNPGQDNGHG
jgi:molybdopterin-containing oxidoreductase family iron-sulfur binding subunit